MIKANIMPANDLYKWFNQTIYLFHVPLFFICSGYLYQKLSHVDSFGSWKKNIERKALVLGVPYFTFSTATWLLKLLFSKSINNGVEENLFSMLFLHPVSPYWYLYALFLIFLVTPTFKSIPMAITGLIIALIGKMITFTQGITVYAASTVLTNEIWFVIGMCLAVSTLKLSKKWKNVGIILGVFFLSASVVTYVAEIRISGISFLLGVVACAAVIAMTIGVDNERKQRSLFVSLAKYTMPIFLMHTLFAAGVRSILLKCAIDSAVIHVVIGILISFLGPIIAAKIMEKIKFLEFILYPGKFIKIK